MSSQQAPGPVSSITQNAQAGTTAPAVRRGRAAVELPESFAGALRAYTGALAAALLAELSRRTYASKVRQYLAWLAAADADGDPFETADGRDRAVRDYRTHLQASFAAAVRATGVERPTRRAGCCPTRDRVAMCRPIPVGTSVRPEANRRDGSAPGERLT